MSYKTYKEAKLAMPLACIIHDTDNDRFFGMPSREGTTLTDDGCEFAEAKDHCKTLGWLRVNHGFEREGDVIIGHSSGRVITITHDKIKDYDDKCLVLRAAALENQMNIDNLATQTPEEKEALDLIDTTPHQYEMSKFVQCGHSVGKALKAIDDLDKFNDASKLKRTSLHKAADVAEWNGEGLPPVGVECEYKDGDNWYEVKVSYLSEWFIVIEALKSQSKWIDIKGTEISFDHSRFDDLKFRKPETPQQREDRERLEAAYDLYLTHEDYIDNPVCSLSIFSESNEPKNKWLRIVDKTNYRKESK